MPSRAFGSLSPPPMPTLRPPADPRSDSPSAKRTRVASARKLLTSDDLDLVRQGAQRVAALDDAELYERLLDGVRWEGKRWAPNKIFAALRASATAMDLSGTDAEKLIDLRCVRGFERLKQLALRGARAAVGGEALASLDALRSLHIDKVGDVREVLSGLPAGLRSLEVDLTTAAELSLTPLQDLPRLSRIVIPMLHAPGTVRPSVPQGFRPRVVRRR